MGFLYSPTCVAAWKLVGSETRKNAAIAAAAQLVTSFRPDGSTYHTFFMNPDGTP